MTQCDGDRSCDSMMGGGKMCTSLYQFLSGFVESQDVRIGFAIPCQRHRPAGSNIVNRTQTGTSINWLQVPVPA